MCIRDSGHLPEEYLAVALHPAPVYAMLHATWLALVVSRIRTRQRFAGEAILSFVGLYGLGRTVLEVFRADRSRGLYFEEWLSTSQIIGLLTAAVACGLWARGRSTSTRS